MSNDQFRPVTGFPGYRIAKDGRVQGKTGKILRSDVNGCVGLMRNGAKQNVSVVELLIRAWGKRALAAFLEAGRNPAQAPELAPECGSGTALPAPDPAPADELRQAQDQVNALKQQLAQLGRKAAYQRKFNATLWSRLRSLEASLAGASRAKAKELVTEEREEWEGMSGAFENLPDDLPELPEVSF